MPTVHDFEERPDDNYLYFTNHTKNLIQTLKADRDSGKITEEGFRRKIKRLKKDFTDYKASKQEDRDGFGASEEDYDEKFAIHGNKFTWKYNNTSIEVLKTKEVDGYVNYYGYDSNHNQTFKTEGKEVYSKNGKIGWKEKLIYNYQPARFKGIVRDFIFSKVLSEYKFLESDEIYSRKGSLSAQKMVAKAVEMGLRVTIVYNNGEEIPYTQGKNIWGVGIGNRFETTVFRIYS